MALLHDHELYLRCDPHMSQCEALPTPTPAPSLPTCLQPAPQIGADSDRPPTWSCFRVTDVVHALPGLWDSNVVSEYEFCLLDRGVFVRIRGPLRMVMETTCVVCPRGEGDDLFDLVEDVLISCSRLLIPFIKGQCEANWRGIHASLMKPLAVDVVTPLAQAEPLKDSTN